jgi:hypothetical protein
MRTPDQPLSKSHFEAVRVLVMLVLAASLACAVVGWLYWHSLTWPYRVVLEVIPLFAFGSRADVRRAFISYSRYRREWEEVRSGSDARGRS